MNSRAEILEKIRLKVSYSNIQSGGMLLLDLVLGLLSRLPDQELRQVAKEILGDEQ